MTLVDTAPARVPSRVERPTPADAPGRVQPPAPVDRPRRARRRPAHRGRRRAGSAVRWLALVVVVALVWPINLGGLFGGIVVSGHSMEPDFFPGDIAVVMRTDEIGVGDVVVFRPEVAPDARVVHRIVAVDGELLELRGDNNDWSDPFDVVQDDVVGKVILRVPEVGGWLLPLAHPFVWVSLLLLGTGWWLWPRRDEGDGSDGSEEAPGGVDE